MRRSNAGGQIRAPSNQNIVKQAGFGQNKLTRLKFELV